MIIGRYADWIKTFEVEEYLQTAPLIEKSHEEKQLALVSADELQERLESSDQALHQARLEIQELRHKVSDLSRRSLLVFLLSLSSLLYSWLFIAFGCVLEIIAFIARPKVGKQGQATRKRPRN